MSSSATTSTPSKNEWKDITNEIKLAAKELLSPNNPILHGPDYNPEISLHSTELMDPRLDGGAAKTSLPSIAERIQNSSLPVTTLNGTQVITIIDQLLQLYSSYLYGNSIPQTLYRNLYIHPTTLASLCTFVGIPVQTITTPSTKPVTLPSSTDIVYKHAVSPTLESSILTKHLRQVYPDNAVAAPGEAPTDVVNLLRKSIETLKELTIGSSVHTLLTILLASCFAVLKITGLSFETVLVGDIQREDDFVAASYGTDLLFNLSSTNVLYVLRLAEYMLIQSNSSIDNEVNTYVDQITANREKLGSNSSGASGSSKAKKKKSKNKKKSEINDTSSGTSSNTTSTVTEISVPPFLSLDNVVTANDVFGEGVQPDSGFYRNVLQQTKFEPLPTSPSTTKSPLSTDAMLLVRLRYLRSYLIVNHYLSPANAPESSPPLAWGRTFALESIHTAATQAWDYLQTIRLTCPFLIDSTLTDEKVPGYFPLYQGLFISAHAPRVQPIPNYTTVFDWSNRHLSSITYVTQLPAFASHNPHRPVSSLLLPSVKLHVPTSTVPLQDLTSVARSLAIDDTVPVPLIPYSGLRDKPLVIAKPSSTTGLSSSAPSPITSSSSSSSSTRSHVSLHALMQLLTDFLARDADILVRSFLRMVVIYFPTGAILSTIPDLPAPSYQELPGVPPATDHWKYNQLRSSVILGTHTLSEIIESSMYDVGVSAELIATVDGQRAVEFCDSLFSSTLAFICLSPVRFRRHLEKELPEWYTTLNETDFIENLYRMYVEQRYITLRENYLNPTTGSTAYDITRFTAFAPQDRRLMFVLLRTIDTIRPLFNWLEYFCLSLLKTYIRLGIESNIYHPDEILSVAWHLETVNKNVQRVQYLSEMGRVLHWLLPELHQCSDELQTILGKNQVPMLHRIVTEGEKVKEGTDTEGSSTKPKADKEKEFQLQVEEDTLLNYVKEAVDQALGRRTSFRDKYLIATETSYYAVLIRALLGAKLGGVYSGLGVELCGVSETMSNFLPGLELAMGKLGKWTPESTATHFRHPAFLYNKRWATFNEFEYLAKTVTFAKYIATFAAPCTIETLIGLASEAQQFVRLGVLNCSNLVNGIETMFATGTTTVFADRIKTPPETIKKAGKGKDTKSDSGNSTDFESSALSSFDVLMSARDMKIAQSFMFSTDTTMRTLEIIGKSPFCRALVAYRYTVSLAERAAWEAESAQASLAIKTATIQPQDVKRLQVVAKVEEKRLDNLEQSAQLTLPPRSTMQSPFVFELLRILEAHTRDQYLNYMKNQTMQEIKETTDETKKNELQQLLDELKKDSEQPSKPRPAVRTPIMNTMGNQKSLTNQIGVTVSSILGVPTNNPLETTDKSTSGTKNIPSLILPGNTEDKRGMYIITIKVPPSM